jgi:hypothetical protein
MNIQWLIPFDNPKWVGMVFAYMKGLIKEIMTVVGVVILAGVMCATPIIAPILYFEGTAKSNWLKQTRGVDIPWYSAMWLDVQINDVGAEVHSK